MFSVVVPTIWKSNCIIELLINLNSNKSISEIILIDNAPEKSVLKDVPVFNKLKIFKFEQNLFVNPSWNFGVDASSEDNVILCNDDILFNTGFLDNLIVPDETLIGIDTGCYSLKTNKEFFLKDVDSIKYGFGCLMIFNKKFYQKIPNGLKIFYGDNFLFETFKHRKTINGLMIKSKMSSSSGSPEFKSFGGSDGRIYSKLNLKNR